MKDIQSFSINTNSTNSSIMNIQESRFKNLAKSKAFRDSIALWGEPAKLTRKRVLIAPCFADVAYEEMVSTNFKHIEPIETKSESEEKFSDYKSWIEQRKTLRRQFEQCANRPVIDPENLQQVTSIISNDEMLQEYSEDDEVIIESHLPNGQPSIKHPLPQKALGKIHKFLNEKKMRVFDLFVQADRDKDWKLTKNEFLTTLQTFGIQIDKDEMQQLILALDQNNDDVLEYKELIHGLSKYSKREKLQQAQLKKFDGSAIMEVEEADLDEEITVGDQPPRQNSSLLSLPDISSNELALNVEEEKRLKKQKRREKHRNKLMKSSESIPRQSCTMKEETGHLVDKYQERCRREYEKILELCHLHGVKLSRNLLERVLLHPEDRSFAVCLSSLSPPEKNLPKEYVFRKTEDENLPLPSFGQAPSKLIRRKSSLFSNVYPPASTVRPRKERMLLSSGSAEISRKINCWMTYEEYRSITRHLDSRFDKSWKPSDSNAYWPSYVSDKVRLYLDKPGTPARDKNTIFEIINNRTIH